MVCFAMIMDQSGMTYLLAEGVSQIFGKAYPVFASSVGTLGAFMTGSNTNSNVVFGMLQKQTAELAGLSIPVVLGAQTTGGSIGSMLAPAKILVGCSTVGLSGKEGPVLRTTLKYGVIITGLIGLLALAIISLGVT
jgi:lactate permease